MILRKLFKCRDRDVYYCNALFGQSTYNICINCDMTVSCNCQDYDGSGQIGDLHENRFEEIFRGEKARQFRETLARGEFPVSLCPHCPELRTVKEIEVKRYLNDFDMPRKAIMVENTILCNLQCLFCDRDKTARIRKKSRMSLDDMEHVARILHQHQIEAISLHNLGEPFVSDTFFEEVNLLIKYNPDLKIYLSTNGALIDSDKKVEACLMLEHIYFSIDGPSQEILVRYQVGGNFERSYENVKRVIALRNARGKKTPTIEWKYVVFNWNDQEEHIEAAIQLAKNAGVDLISFTQGGAPLEHTSRRYQESPYFESLGVASWRGRELWL